MTVPLQVGDSVRAAHDIIERDFMGKHAHVHAEEGELGFVMGVDAPWFTVTWNRTGTTLDVHESEVRWISSLEARSMPENRAIL